MSPDRNPRRSQSTSRGSPSPLRGMYLDQSLTMDFFSNFSRFEYALKEAGYVKRNEQYGNAEIDWRKFRRAIRHSYNPEMNPEVADAVEYLFSEPPRSHALDSGSLTWEDLERKDYQTDIDWLLLLVKTVRNNLFHGSKYAYYSREELDRDTQLLKSSLVVLKAFISWNPKVKRHFEQSRE